MLRRELRAHACARKCARPLAFFACGSVSTGGLVKCARPREGAAAGPRAATRAALEGTLRRCGSTQAPQRGCVEAAPAASRLRVRLRARALQVRMLDALGLRLVARRVVVAIGGLGFLEHGRLR